MRPGPGQGRWREAEGRGRGRQEPSLWFLGRPGEAGRAVWDGLTGTLWGGGGSWAGGSRDVGTGSCWFAGTGPHGRWWAWGMSRPWEGPSPLGSQALEVPASAIRPPSNTPRPPISEAGCPAGAPLLGPARRSQLLACPGRPCGGGPAGTRSPKRAVAAAPAEGGGGTFRLLPRPGSKGSPRGRLRCGFRRERPARLRERPVPIGGRPGPALAQRPGPAGPPAPPSPPPPGRRWLPVVLCSELGLGARGWLPSGAGAWGQPLCLGPPPAGTA